MTATTLKELEHIFDDPNPVLDMLTYDPTVGGSCLVWKKQASARVKIGAMAGTKNMQGYWQIGIKGKIYLAHRLVWEIVNGSEPKKRVRHINGVKTDNRAENLTVEG